MTPSDQQAAHQKEQQHSASSTLTWMVRTTDNVISGPYTQKQIIQLLEDGKLELTDEICHSNHYWIALHEQEEVKKQLGIGLPRSIFELEDSTQTETDSHIAAAMSARAEKNSTLSEPSTQSSGMAPSSMASSNSQEKAQKDSNDDGIPELPEVDDGDGYTAVMSNRAFREFRPRDVAVEHESSARSEEIGSTPAKTFEHLPDLEPEVEPFRYWLIGAIALGATAVFFLFKILLEMQH